MSWNPAQNTIDTTQFEANLLEFIAAYQTDALAWANGGDALKPFVFLADNLANPNNPKFPSLVVTGESENIPVDDDAIETVYRIEFEAVMAGNSAALVHALAKKYALALKSMLANISMNEINANVSGTLITKPSQISTSFSELHSNEQETLFFQVFQTRATYRLWASSYH